MRRIVWLASYPKSGNTWFRMLIENLSSRDGEPAHINAMSDADTIASLRRLFDQVLLLESGALTHDEVDAIRPALYGELLNGPFAADYSGELGKGPVKFLKVHDAYRRNRDGAAILAGGAAAIQIVRDPRDVAVSMAHHRGISADEAVALMSDETACQCGKLDREDTQVRHVLLDWSGHVASWLDQTDIPVHLVRFEDLKAHTAPVFHAAMLFAGREVTRQDAERAAAHADFAILTAQERESGFAERSRRSRTPFFRRGQAGAWRDELTRAQVERIEVAHGAMMRRLGYEASGAGVAANVGRRE